MYTSIDLSYTKERKQTGANVYMNFHDEIILGIL